MVPVFFFAKSAFTTVAGNIAPVAGKQVDGQKTMVGAVLTSGQLCIKG